MIKRDLVVLVSEKTGISRETVSDVVESFIKTTKSAVANGNNIEIRGFITIKLVKKNGRAGRNFKTGKRIEMVPFIKPVIKASTAFVEQVNSEE